MRSGTTSRRRTGERLRLRLLRGAHAAAATPPPGHAVLVLPDVAPGTRLTLGRSRASDVRLLEPTVSRRHAALERVDGGWLLTDRASTHGTFLNGRRVDRAIVADGDRLDLGGHTPLVLTVTPRP